MVTDVLVLGGGLAGGAGAVLAARAGLGVRLLEREAAPRNKMCGEFLSIEAQQHLRALGVDMAALDAVPIDRVRLVAAGRTAEARLPFRALGVSRKCLDEALLDCAARAGARIERGVRATRIEGAEVVTSSGTRRANHIFLATGKHDLRGAKREAGGRSRYVGFKMHWRLSAPQRGAMRDFIELVAFDGGYGGLQMVGADTANLCLIVSQERLEKLGGQWAHLLEHLLRDPHLLRRLGDAEPLFDRPVTIANLPYGYVCRDEGEAPPCLFRLGDQAAMTASLTGDGMAIALRSASLAVDMVAAGRSGADYHAHLARHVAGQVRRAMLLQRMTESRIAMALGMGALRLWPNLLGVLARATRLPGYEVGRHGFA